MNSSSRLIRAFTAALKTLFFLSGSMFSKNQRKNCPKFSAETDRVKNVVEKCGQSGHVRHARVEPGKTGKVRKEVILRQPYLDVRYLLILVDVCPYGGYDALIKTGRTDGAGICLLVVLSQLRNRPWLSSSEILASKGNDVRHALTNMAPSFSHRNST